MCCCAIDPSPLISRSLSSALPFDPAVSRAVDQRATRAPRASRAERPLCFGDFYATRIIAEGRWTRVYAARPNHASGAGGEDYAVKFLRESYADSATARAMLQREAQLGRRIRHQHLAPVLASGQLDGRPYVVMPLIAGETLEAIIARQSPLAAPWAFWIARQVATALAVLHEQGLMHSDVKPANIVVSPLGHATLLDLGLAQRIDGGPRAGRPLMGTLAYCAPESFTQHGCLSGRSDVYSLGVTLFRALAGALPFPYEEPDELAAAHLTLAAPDARKLAPQLSNRTARLLRTLLSKEPLRRPTAQELASWLIDLEIDTLEECVPA